MGVVFEGVAEGGDPVAIKVVTTELSQDEVFVRRFQREVAAAQKISHPHVVPVLGAGEEGGLPYLVQALIAGGSLHDRLVKDGKLDLATTIRMLRGPAEGIDALQARQHPARRRDRVRDRLRSGQGQPGVEPDPSRPGTRFLGLHGARTDPW
jgi:serine/threonine protein kinase